MIRIERVKSADGRGMLFCEAWWPSANVIPFCICLAGHPLAVMPVYVGLWFHVIYGAGYLVAWFFYG